MGLLELVAGKALTTAATAALKKSMTELLVKRDNETIQVLHEALQKGKMSINDFPDSDVAAKVYKLLCSGRQGAARENLKLLSNLIAGRGDKKPFDANEFLQWADVIAALRREEVLILSVLHLEATKINYQLDFESRIWVECVALLDERYGMGKDAVDTHGAALLRTGLIRFGIMTMDGSMHYLPTKQLERIAELADFEAYYMDQ